MAKKDNFFSGRIRSFGDAFRGIWAVLKTQPNFRIQLAAAVAAVSLSVWLQISPLEWVAIVFCCSLVLGAETFNTVIEILCDKIEPEFDESIGKAKDMAAAAVLIFSIGALIIGGIIFIPKIMEYLR